MKKKIFLCLLCLPVLFGITGCGNEKNNDMIDTKNNKSIEEKKPKVVSGDGKTIGDEVCLGEECFYVIKYDFNKEDIYLLAKYNLNAGGYYESTISDFKDSNSRIHRFELASVGILKSPRGDTATDPTFGPSGRQVRLKCCAKKRHVKVLSHL